MIGRERELARLRRALDELEAGVPAVVAVAGEPGIGKSRLLRASSKVASSPATGSAGLTSKEATSG
jgi:predicted ATPase